MPRKLYLAAFAVLIILLMMGALYVRHRDARSAADCDTPAASPAKSAAPPPHLPGFKVEEGCGAGAATPAAKKQTR